MSKLITALGAALVLMGLLIAVFPEQFISLLAWDSRTGQYLAAGIRVVTGLILLLGASETRYPTVFRVFGWLVLLVGLTIPLIPLELWAALIGWAILSNPALVRFGAGIGGPLIGGLILYGARPERADG